jgi:hypothetical protein
LFFFAAEPFLLLFAPAVGGVRALWAGSAKQDNQQTMTAMEEDNIVEALIGEGPAFEHAWSTFLFNVPMALKLREKEKEMVLQILTAGQRYAGTGWTTGRASQTLFQLSGVAIVRGQIDGYRDCWLYAVAMLPCVDLPSVELAPEVAHAAFSLVNYQEQPEEEPQTYGQPEADESDEEVSFDWDEPTVQLPKPLAALWARSTDTELKVSMKTMLEGFPRLAGLTARPPENNLCSEWRKRQDGTYKVLSQHVLHLLRVWAYRWSKPEGLDKNVDLQLCQYGAELYHKIQGERRELSLPGSSKSQANSSTEMLFTEEDVKKARTEHAIKDLNKKGVSFLSDTNFSVGGPLSASRRQSFLSPHSGGARSWRGPPRPFQTGRGFPGGRGGGFQRFTAPYKGFGKGFKGAKGKGGKAKGILPTPPPCHGDNRGLSQGGTVNSQGGILPDHGGRSSKFSGPISEAQSLPALVAGKCPPPFYSESNNQGRGT